MCTLSTGGERRRGSQWPCFFGTGSSAAVNITKIKGNATTLWILARYRIAVWIQWYSRTD